MGCDGGTIPKRDELVKQKKKPEAKDKDAERAFQWQCCAITQEKLQEPIVTCGWGKIYSKTSLIEALLNKAQHADILQHIKSLKDVKNLSLTPNPAYNEKAHKREGFLDDRSVPYICPLIGLEMSGKFPFVCLWSCGCVMSERAIKEIKTETCPKCQKAFTKQDIIILNASGEDLEKMKRNTEERQLLMKASKKSKTKKIKEEVPDSNYTVTEISNETPTSSNLEMKPMTSNLEMKPPLNLPKAGSSKSSAITKHKLESQSNTLIDPEIKKIKMDYSVAKDSNATDVYKSLFTSHASEKKQERAHWITYNPFYN